MTIQEQLNEAYRSLVDWKVVYERLGQSEATDAMLRELDGPFLVATNDQYESSHPRVIIVGQENNGWNPQYFDFISARTVEDALQDLLQGYRDFDLERSYNRTFFQQFANIRNAIRGSCSDLTRRSVIWSNLFKLNHNGKQTIHSPYCEQILAVQGNIFQMEMEVLRPDAVIFLTGPRYNWIIQRFYPDAEFVAVDGHPTNEIAWVKSKQLPCLSYRTYHPNYFNRIKRTKPYCYEAIIERIQEG